MNVRINDAFYFIIMNDNNNNSIEDDGGRGHWGGKQSRRRHSFLLGSYHLFITDYMNLHEHTRNTSVLRLSEKIFYVRRTRLLR